MSFSDNRPKNVSDTGKEQSSSVAKQRNQKTPPPEKNIVRRCIIKYTYFFDVAAAAAIVATIILLLVSFTNYLSLMSNAGGHWHHYEAPAHNFTDWSIASTSEHCDEYARQMIMESHPMQEVTLMMMICLHHFEPQASSVMGSSTLLYSRVNQDRLQCYQSTANHAVSFDIIKFSRALLLSADPDFAGPLTSAYPMDIRSFASLANSMGENVWQENWESVRKKIEIEWGDVEIPASKRLVDALNSRVVELQMFARGQHSKFVADVQNEGDGFRNELNFEFLLKLTAAVMNGFGKDEDKKWLAKEVEAILTEMDKEEKEVFVSNWISRLTGGLETVAKPLNLFGYQICAPKLHNKKMEIVMDEPLIITGLRTMQELDAEKPLSAPENLLYQDEKHYQRVSTAMQNVYKQTSAFGKKNWDKWDKSVQEKYKKLALYRLNNTKQGKDVPLYGNSFVIVNHKTQEAAAYGATLGTNFGSVTSHRGLIFMNNLLAHSSEHFVTVGDVYYYYEPVMIYRLIRGSYKHLITYMDLSESRMPSTSFARKISSIFLTLFYKIKLKNALSWTLYYVDFANVNRISREIPWRRYINILKLNNAENKNKSVLYEKDYVMAVDGTETINFMADSTSPNWKPPMGV